MSNHFPVPPSVSLTGVTYTAAIEQVGQNWPSAGFAAAGVTATDVQFAATQEQTGIFSITFSLDTPGDPGSFDQDTVEAQLVLVLNDLAQAVATTGALTLAQVQSYTTVSRRWTWADATGAYVTVYTDTMTYPPAA